MQTTSDSFRRELGDGLVLRWSTDADTERIATLQSLVHRDKADEPPNTYAIRLIRAMMHGDYPLMGAHDFGIVEDTSQEGCPVVAATCLWQHTWAYEGFPFGVGRPEMVATDPAYRNRGLVRALFEMIHARSEARGDLVQAITGIPYFYRQFGYEYALELEDRRSTPLALLPAAREGEQELFTLREATAADIPEIEALFQRRRDEFVVMEVLARRQLLYEIETWKTHPELGRVLSFQMIIDAAGQTAGFLACDAERHGQALRVWLLECAAGINVQSAIPAILRALRIYGFALEPVLPGMPAFQEISFALGTAHPVHAILGEVLDRPKEPAYAWYIRVKDLPGFLLHIAPALEKRLAASPIAGYSGEIKLNFYRGGLRLVFERGRLVGAEDWRKSLYEAGESGGFPPLVFLQVLFGHRSIAALRDILPDAWVSDEARPVLQALFPTRPSLVLGQS